MFSAILFKKSAFCICVLNLLRKSVNLYYKGVIYMLNSKKIMTKAIKNIVDHTLTRDANSTTCTAIYQPKAPAALNKYKKAEK